MGNINENISKFVEVANELLKGYRSTEKELQDETERLTKMLIEKDKTIKELNEKIESLQVVKQEEKEDKCEETFEPTKSPHPNLFYGNLNTETWHKFKSDLIEKKGKCECCGSTKALTVSVKNHNNFKRPWEYPQENYHVMCFNCVTKHGY